MTLSFFRARGGSARQETETTKLYYASDVHGSERCWRKFLAAGRHYGVSALIMGGDLTGKAIVPVTRTADGRYEATLFGEQQTADSPEALTQLEQAIRDNGFYPWVASAQEITRYSNDAEAQAKLFEEVIVAETRRWMTIADARFERDQIPVYVMAGNDDPWAVDGALARAVRVISTEPGVVRVNEHEMISCSYTNPTPWSSPRELPEEHLYVLLKELAQRLEDPSRAIFNLHAPPYDSGLDTACQLTPDFRIKIKHRAPVEAPVGSTAVRQIIEEYQPLLALHGHIHESRGAAHIGRTLCVNSGSEYNSGRIHGVVVQLGSNRVLRHQFVVG